MSSSTIFTRPLTRLSMHAWRLQASNAKLYVCGTPSSVNSKPINPIDSICKLYVKPEDQHFGVMIEKCFGLFSAYDTSDTSKAKDAFSYIPFRDYTTIHNEDCEMSPIHYQPRQLSDGMHPNWFLSALPDQVVWDFTNGCTQDDILGCVKYTTHDHYKEYIANLYDEEEQCLKVATRNPLWYMHERLCMRCCSTQRYLVSRTGVIGTDFFMNIPIADYMEMQQTMAVLGVKWCDYITKTDNIHHKQRVPFNEPYWQDFMYPALVDFIEKEVIPAMDDGVRAQFVENNSLMVHEYNKKRDL